MRVPPQARQICKELRARGFQAFLVGGCVRDALMGTEPKDWDVATNATPDQTQQLPFKTVPTGIDYGTITAIVDDMHVEITTFRYDSQTSDGRRPTSVVFGCSIQEDLARRDFTCNAIAYDPIAHRTIDPFDGQGDIQRARLVSVGEPRFRFREDALRLLRAVRFACTKRFAMAANLDAAIVDSAHLVENVSKERVRDELLKIISSKTPSRGMNILASTGLLKFVYPELLNGIGMHQNEFHAFTVWVHVGACLDSCVQEDPILRLAVLLHDIAKPATRSPHPKRPGQFQFINHEELGAEMAETWMKEMKFSNEETSRVRHLIRHHLIFYERDWNDSQVRRWVQRVGKETIPDILSMARADLLGKGLDVKEKLTMLDELEQRAMTLAPQVVRPGRDLAISGNDVMQILGLTIGGPRVGQCLKFLSDAVLERPEVNNREDLLALVTSWAASDG